MSSPGSFAQPPDLSGYVDLRIHDVPDQDMIDAALANLRLAIPELDIREGHIEAVLIESLALEVSEIVVAVNRLPGAVVEAVLHLAGVDKDYGGPATAMATFTLGDTLGHTIPGGTRLFLPLDDGTAITFLVEPPGVVVAPGSDTGTASLIAAEYSARGNGVPAGTRLIPADALPYIERVELSVPVADGRDTETDDTWRDRGVARLARLSDALVLPRHFQAATAERAEVGRVTVIDNYNPPSGTAGSDAGHVTVAVLGTDGNALSTAAKAAIEADLEADAATMLVVHVVDAAVATVTVATTVRLLPGYDNAAATAAIQDAVAGYLNPLTWQYGGTVRRFELVSLVDQAAGVDYVTALTINGAATDYAMPSATSVPKAGTVTVTIS